VRPLATSFALAGLALAVSCAAACSSTPDASPAPTESTAPTSTTDAVQGPLSGTYSADTMDGTAPFITITFLDQSHYQYVAKSCVAVDLSEPGDDGDDDDGGVTSYPDLGADPGDQVADNGATPDYDADPTDDGCIHSGTYSFTATTLTLTDDGATAGVTVPIGQIAADGSEVTDPSATVLNGASASQSLEGATKPDSLVVGGSSALFGTTSVSQFSAAGMSLRRTGLATGSGVGTACTVSTTGVSGTCMTTSSCAAAGKTSTPDYCPGPANVQCCTTGSGSSGSGGSGGTNTMSGLVTAAAVATAETWVSVKMPYCQAANGGRELDSACYNVTGRTCTRTGAANQAKWNKYRSDCSGLVSYSWGLPAPGLTTSGFLPGTAKYIPMEDLQPGDALIRPGTHMVLFKAWKNKAAGTATVVSEPGCSAKGGPYAQEQSWSMGKAPGAATSAHWAGATYYSIRKKTPVLAQ
jgi:hypothetical protein